MSVTVGERDGSEPRTGLARVLPIWGWAPHYRRSWLRPDLIAGLTVAALVVPKALGYAGIAEVPIQYGLYAAAAGAILYALFCTSRQISTGPSAALSAVAAGAVLGAAASGEQAITMVASITFVSGILFAVLAVFKMGWISNFLSKAVIVGFLFGAAIQTTIGELAKAWPRSGGSRRRLLQTLRNAGVERPRLAVRFNDLSAGKCLRFCAR